MANQYPKLEVRRLSKHFPIKRGFFFPKRVGTMVSVEDVSFSIKSGKTLSVVGESGAGKTTLGMVILGLLEATSGSVFLDGKDLTQMTSEELRKARRQMQVVFPDPFSSFNPRHTVSKSIETPLRNFGWTDPVARRKRVLELLRTVGLDPSHADRLPHQFSGGQIQRLGLARALALHPSFIVLDEAVSALDVSIQAQILNLLSDLQREFGLTFLFIAHNLNVVDHLSNDVAVMFRGRIVEIGPREGIFTNPRHPYTYALLAAGSRSGRMLRAASLATGSSEDETHATSEGCGYRLRCHFAEQVCVQEVPKLTQFEPGHYAACHVALRSPTNWLQHQETKRASSSEAQMEE